MPFMGNIFYLNFHSVGTLIAVCFNLSAALFLLSIRKKSAASRYMGLGFLLMVFHPLAYLVGNVFYHPLAAYHRCMLPVVTAALIYFTQFLFHFPQPKTPRLARGFLIGQWIVTAVFWPLWATQIPTSGLEFNLLGHYWTFPSYLFNRLFSIHIILYVFIMVGVGVWRVISVKGKERWTILAILLAMMITSIVPAIANMLSHEGAMDRNTYQIIYSVMTVVGFFLLLVLYINITKDRTTFMARLSGISLVTFLVVFVLVSFFILNDKDRTYDTLQVQKIPRITGNSNYRPPDLAYVVRSQPLAGVVKTIYRHDRTHSLEPGALQASLVNTALWARMAELPQTNYLTALKQTLSNVPPSFAGYRAAILKQAQHSRLQGEEVKTALLRYLGSVDRLVLYQYNQLRKFSALRFAQQARSYLKAQTDGNFGPFAIALLQALDRPAQDRQRLRRRVLTMLAPLHPPRTRLYRADTNGERHFVAFQTIVDGTVYETGFSYRDYRAFLHPLAAQLAVTIIVIILLVSLGFRVFFYGTLLSPLRSLLAGVRRVNLGELDIKIPVKVEDEIGFLTRSFNMMVQSIRRANQKLKQYADSLEEKVAERTQELVEAKQETDTIMRTVNEGLFLLHRENGSYAVGAQYSSALEEILVTNNLAQRDYLEFMGELLHSKKQDNLAKYLELMFEGTVDEDTVNELNPVAQHQFVLSDNSHKYLQFRFTRVAEGDTISHLLVLVRDVTSQVVLSEKLRQTEEKARGQMEQLFSILQVDPGLLAEFLSDMEQELSAVNRMLHDSETAATFNENLGALYRSVHTVKGNASILNLNFVAAKAHVFEERLKQLAEQDRLRDEDVQTVHLLYQDMAEVLHELRNLVERLLQFQSTFGEKRLSSGDLLLKAIEQAVQRISREQGKEVLLLSNNFDGHTVPAHYNRLLRDVLVQLVRNAISHGIEPPEERERLRKKERGTISISTSSNKGALQLVFRDDGRGIQLDKLGKAAIAAGRVTEEQVQAMRPAELARLMYLPGISTASATDLSAGRGVGMDVIKVSIEEAGGTIRFSSEPGKYTEFRITLPAAAGEEGSL